MAQLPDGQRARKARVAQQSAEEEQWGPGAVQREQQARVHLRRELLKPGLRQGRQQVNLVNEWSPSAWAAG